MEPLFKVGQVVTRGRSRFKRYREVVKVINPYSPEHLIGYEWKDQSGGGKCSEKQLKMWATGN